ncbi:MAG TPA: hypothetical protein VK324_11400 [Tepidisphaeraceae bacterium]|nr:hypothetical protein [Tepidisphaeraceae bacterium]
MKSNTMSIVALAAAATALSVAGYAAAQDASQPQPKSGGQQQGPNPKGQGHGGGSQPSSQQDQTPAGFVLVQERVIALTANEPRNHFLRSQEALLRNDHKTAAAEARVAAAYLDMQASRGIGGTDSALSRSADHLRQCAEQLAQAGQKSDQQDGQQQQAGQ